mgnify:CR=1 FL=1|tara:strand:+ start:376 stop:558 length:183 start_codon:yes stop_codon:yes gene_type:complete
MYFYNYKKKLGSLIIDAAIIIAAYIYIEFNPYETCRRDLSYNSNAAIICSGSGALVLYYD